MDAILFSASIGFLVFGLVVVFAPLFKRGA